MYIKKMYINVGAPPIFLTIKPWKHSFTHYTKTSVQLPFAVQYIKPVIYHIHLAQVIQTPPESS